MRRASLALLVMMAGAAAPAFLAPGFGMLGAQEAPASESSAPRLSPAGDAKVDGKTWKAFSGPGGLRVLAASPFDDATLPRLERVAEAAASWSALRAVELRAETSGEEGDAYVVLVTQALSGGKDYAPNLPSGIRLRFAGALLYDFRVKSGDYFVRVKGVLVDEASLASEIAKAADDPAAFIAERDPAWAAGRIVELESTIESSAQAIEAIRTQLAAEMNRGFFGNPRHVPPAIVEAIRSLKRESPTAPRAEAAAVLKERGIKASAREIDAVYRAWFGE